MDDIVEMKKEKTKRIAVRTREFLEEIAHFSRSIGVGSCERTDRSATHFPSENGFTRIVDQLEDRAALLGRNHWFG